MSFFGPSAHRQMEILTTIQLLLTRAFQSVSVGISGGSYVEKDTQIWYRMISLVSYVPQLGWPCDMYRAWHALISGLLPVSYFVLYACKRPPSQSCCDRSLCELPKRVMLFWSLHVIRMKIKCMWNAEANVDKMQIIHLVGQSRPKPDFFWGRGRVIVSGNLMCVLISSVVRFFFYLPSLRSLSINPLTHPGTW